MTSFLKNNEFTSQLMVQSTVQPPPCLQFLQSAGDVLFHEDDIFGENIQS